jgi:hypothetical protein
LVIIARSVVLLLLLVPAACVAPPAPQYGSTVRPNAAAVPSGPAKSIRWNGVFSCTAHIEGRLPAITWTHVPFRQEGDRLSGVYTFTDHFKHKNSVVFSGSLSGNNARATVTSIRAGGSPNFTAEVSGSPALMTGQMMSGMSQSPVRVCTLALSAA